MMMSRNRGQKSRLLTVLSHPDDDDNDDGRVRERRKTLDKEVSNKLMVMMMMEGFVKRDSGQRGLRYTQLHPYTTMCLRVADKKSSI